MMNNKKELKDRLKVKIDNLPEEKLYDVSNFLESIKIDIHESKILSYAGLWNDMNDEILNEFTNRRRSNRKRFFQ